MLSLEVILGAIGIIATIVVGIGVYRLQRKEKEYTDDILRKINSVTLKQSEILDWWKIQRRKHVDWFVYHVGGALQTLIKDYQELNEGLTKYQNDTSEENLKSIMDILDKCRTTLAQLVALAERDILVAAAHIANPWIEGKFLEVILSYETGIFLREETIRSMDNDQLSQYKQSVQLVINKMQNDLEIIQKEKKIEELK